VTNAGECGKRRCIFCDGQLGAERAKEHVIPQWLLSHLNLTEEDLFQFVATSADFSIVRERVIANRAFVEGRICGNCNGGWMHELEDTAAPLVKSMIDGVRTVHALTEDERFLAARWATKTAYVLSYPTPLSTPVDPSHLRILRTSDHVLPPGVGVFAQQHVPTGKASYFQKNTWPHFSETVPGAQSVAPTSNPGYKIALQFDRLMLLVAYWPPQLSTYALVVGLHVPLWPIVPFYLGYYCVTDVPRPDDSRLLLERFSSTLAICHRSSGRIS
jgi:hypothetical protein